MLLSRLEYELPDELIAREPPPSRDGGRLMLMRRHDASTIEHAFIPALEARIPDRALVVVNSSRVIPARLLGQKTSGGKVEILLVRPLTPDASRWSAMGRATKPLRPNTTVLFGEQHSLRIVERGPDGLLVVELLTTDPWAMIERCGHMPLPPYVHRPDTPSDRERYQTVYARERGSVAAPTAGLHLTNALLDRLKVRGCDVMDVTLHVGPGTFLPVAVSDLDQHPMHSEFYDIPEATVTAIEAAKQTHRPVVAIGTTTVRTLESWALSKQRSGETRLLIQPGFQFQVVTHLLTNFHLPHSTLLALVMAFAGEEATRTAYSRAVQERYRFFSYGDAMFLYAESKS